MSFHVPEKYRVTSGPLGSDARLGNNGLFEWRKFTIIASDQLGWEHVSVSLPTRCPTWEEMCRVKNLFWDAEDCVMQLHPPRTIHVNNHNFCLHLWRPIGVDIPMPAPALVGVLG